MTHTLSTLDWKNLVLHTLDDKLARDVTSLHVNSPFAEWFVVATATSSRHLWALCSAIEGLCKDHGIRPQTQGRHDATEWIVLNANGLFIHLFQAEARAYYQVEDLWRQDDTAIHQTAPTSPSQ